MINNNFLYGLCDLAIGNTVSIPSYLAMGSGSGILSSGDTVTSGEFSRGALTSKTRSGNLMKFIHLRPSTSAVSTPINVIGLMNSSTGGDLWANMLTSSILQTTSFDIDFEIWVQVTGA